MSRSVALTGATGFIGWHVARRFLDSGWHVRALVRPESHRAVPGGVERVVAPLREADIVAACAGVSVLVHLAGAVGHRTDAEFVHTNVEGTAEVARAARRLGIRLVHTSSLGATGPRSPQRPPDEDEALRPINAYGESKRRSEEIVKNLDGTYDIVPEPTTDEVCETCGKPMTIKRSRYGKFLGCTGYPECTTTKAISLGVKCPRPGCGGFIAEKRSRRGKPFYGCSNWAKKQCDFVAWDKPIPQPCPICNAKFVVKKESKRGATLRCLECDWKQGSDETEENAA